MSTESATADALCREAAARKRAEYQGQLLAAIVESANDAVIGTAPDGTISTWNAAAERLFGYTRDEVVGRPTRLLVPPERVEEALRLRDLLDQGVEVKDFETVRRRKDGVDVPVAATISRVLGPNGELIGGSSIVRDITERKGVEAQERLRRQELEAIAQIAEVLAQPGAFAERASRVLEKLADAVQAGRVTLRMPDPDRRRLRLVAAVGARVREAGPTPHFDLSDPKNLSVEAFLQGQTLVSNDFATDPRAWPTTAAAGMRSGAVAVIRASGETLGVIAALSDQAGHFTQERVRLLSAVASSLGALLKNAQLQQEIGSELDRGRERMVAMQQVAARLSLEADPDQALQHVVDAARTQVKGRSAGMVVWDTRGEPVRWVTSGSSTRGGPSFRPPRLGEGLLGLVGEERRPLRTGDPALHPRFRGYGPGQRPIGSLIAVPILSRGRTFGALGVFEKEPCGMFSADDEQVLGLYAALAGVIIENLSLFREIVRERNTLQAVQASMTEGLVVMDSGGGVLYMNEAAADIAGLKAENVIGRKASEFRDVVGKGLQMSPEAGRALSGALAGKGDRPVTVEVKALAPRPRDLLVTAFPIATGDEKRLTGMLFRDVTDERAVDRRRDTFVSVASHELRTPMTTIIGFTELLLAGDVSEDERREWLTSIHQESVRLRAIVEGLLNISRIQSGKLLLRLEPTALGGVLETALRSVGPTTQSHQFATSIPGSLPLVMADRDKLVQVVTNLLSNAAKYSPNGGTVTVSARHEPEPRQVVVSVADQGIGIAAADQAQLFQAFYRVQRPETEGIRGTGLGLYIVKGFVELMGGEVWVESQPGKGSTFFFAVPEAEGRGWRRIAGEP